MTDDELLDRLLTQFRAESAAGGEPDPARALPGRPDLAEGVREVFERTRDVAPRRRAAVKVPALAGYEILREPRRGGMGHVRLAWHTVLRQDGFALLFDFSLAAVEDEPLFTPTHGFVGPRAAQVHRARRPRPRAAEPAHRALEARPRVGPPRVRAPC